MLLAPTELIIIRFVYCFKWCYTVPWCRLTWSSDWSLFLRTFDWPPGVWSLADLRVGCFGSSSQIKIYELTFALGFDALSMGRDSQTGSPKWISKKGPQFEWNMYIQGVSFNWSYPKNHKYGKKLKYQNWSYPKIHKYGKKLKYQNWSPPSNLKLWCCP